MAGFVPAIHAPTRSNNAADGLRLARYSTLTRVLLAVPAAMISFLLSSEPAQADLIAEARLMKIGKRLAVGEVTIYSDGSSDAVAHVTSTYSIPETR